MIFTFDQAHRYYSVRLGLPNLPSRGSNSVRCPFHGDRTASFSLNLDKGGLWNCHACNVGGGLFDFETRMFPGRSAEECWENIYKFSGATPTHDRQERKLGPVVATYQYVGPGGEFLFEKQRHEPKMFTQRTKKDGRWVYSLQGVRKVIYRLPEVMTSQVVFIVEGEKDADALSTALGGIVQVKEGVTATAAVTCNFDGAGKWKDEYSPFFVGRRVVILADNDDAGRRHALEVAKSCVKFAETVKVVKLGGLPEKGDVYDYLQGHGVADLLDEVRKAPLFTESRAEAAVSDKPFFVQPSAILPHDAPGIQWIIPGVIHRGAKGLIVAQPKAGKSMIALDLAVALSAGQPWLGITPPAQVRTAVISREDGPAMTMNRLQQFARGRGLDFEAMPWLHINTFEQRPTFAIDNDEDLDRICKAIKQEGIELCIFDVLNKLHSADENDNTRMTATMARFDTVRIQTGADVTIIHHDAKNSAPGAKKPRGASSIDSWWDWKVSINVDADDDSRKEVFFASKAGMPHPQITVQFQSHPTNGSRIVPLIR
jgi:hypothetical protein